MLSPDYLERAGELVASVYVQVEAEMLDYLVGRMIAGDVANQRSLTAVNNLVQSDAEGLRRIIAAHEGEIGDAVRSEVEDALRASDADDLRRIKQGLGVDLPEVGTRQIAASVAGVEEILARRNLKMPEDAARAFMEQSAWAIAQVNSGHMTAERALHAAVRRLEREGIDVITYRNAKTGRQTVRNKVDVAVRRHIRTQIAQDGMRLTEARLDEAGVELVEVSSHTGSRPSHQEWEGRVYSRSGDKVIGGVRYRDFRSACHVGDVANGLGGANCRHSYAAYFPGMERAYRPNPTHPSGLSNDEAYALTQRQRAMERGIRQTKRELRGAQMLHEADPTPESLAAVADLKRKLSGRQAKLRELVAANPKVLQRSPRREWAGDMPKGGKLSMKARESSTVSGGVTHEKWLEQFDDEVLIAKLRNGKTFEKRGNPSEVVLTKQEVRKIHGAELAHTHTTTVGGTFSADDIDLTILTESPKHTVRSVLDGREYVLEKTNVATKESVKLFAEDFRSAEARFFFDACREVWEQEYEELGMPLDHAGRIRAEKMVKSKLDSWLASNAQNYGYRYFNGIL